MPSLHFASFEAWQLEKKLTFNENILCFSISYSLSHFQKCEIVFNVSYQPTFIHSFVRSFIHSIVVLENHWKIISFESFFFVIIIVIICHHHDADVDADTDVDDDDDEKGGKEDFFFAIISSLMNRILVIICLLHSLRPHLRSFKFFTHEFLIIVQQNTHTHTHAQNHWRRRKWWYWEYSISYLLPCK